MTKALCRKFARRVARQAERFRDWRSQQRVPERTEHERQRALCDLVSLVTDGELGNEAPDRVEDRVERVPVAGEDHPRCKRAGALLAESIEALIDDDARVGLAGPRSLDGIGDAAVHGICDGLRELALQPGRRAEMMEQIRMRAADLRCDRLERYRLRTLFDQQLARGSERDRAAFFGR